MPSQQQQLICQKHMSGAVRRIGRSVGMRDMVNMLNACRKSNSRILFMAVEHQRTEAGQQSAGTWVLGIGIERHLLSAMDHTCIAAGCN